MIRSIEFLETQSVRREEKLARGVALQREVSRLQKAHALTVGHEATVKPSIDGHRDHKRLPAPDAARPLPHSTYEGHLDGHPTGRK